MNTMNHCRCKSIALSVALLLAQAVAAAEASRTDHLSESAAGAELVAASTHNGWIHYHGTDADNVEVTASIKVVAAGAERAQELLAATAVALVRHGSELVVEIDRPRTRGIQSVVVDLDIAAPRRGAARLSTHNGAIEVRAAAELEARTHNGRLQAVDVDGGARVVTHNGAVTLTAFGPIDVETHNGPVELRIEDPQGVVSVSTHNGSIEFDAPDDLSAALDVGTHNGRIRSELPITMRGGIEKSRLRGTIGDGHGSIRLETHNGGVVIR